MGWVMFAIAMVFLCISFQAPLGPLGKGLTTAIGVACLMIAWRMGWPGFKTKPPPKKEEGKEQK